MRIQIFLVAPLALAAVVRAQNVFVVAPSPGPGVFSTSISVAVNAAQDRDVVLVKSGAYTEFVEILGKSLVLEADTGAVVTLSGRIRVMNTSASQPVVIRGLQVATQEWSAIELFYDLGPIWVEDCTLKGGHYGARPYYGCHVGECSAVAITRCTIIGGDNGGDGLTSSAKRLLIADSLCRGADGALIAGWGGNGAVMFGGSFVATGTTFQGGNGADNPTPFPPQEAGHGGAGLWLVTSNAMAVDCTFAGGAGGVSATLGQAHNGADVLGSTLTVLPGAARHFAVDSPVRESQSTALHFGGLANETVGVIYGPAPSPIIPLPAFGGSLLIDAASSSGLIAGNLSPAGTLDVPVAMPALPASVLAVPMHVQAVFFDVPLTYAALGPPSSLLILDSSL